MRVKSANAHTTKVYQAERMASVILATDDRQVKVAGATLTIEPEKKFGTLDSVQRYVDQVLAFLGREDSVTIKPITDRRHKAYRVFYSGREQTIYMFDPDVYADAPNDELVVLHELAHHLTRESDDDHGDLFLQAYINLVENVMSPENGLVLRYCYDVNGITIRHPQKNNKEGSQA